MLASTVKQRIVPRAGMAVVQGVSQNIYSNSKYQAVKSTFEWGWMGGYLGVLDLVFTVCKINI